MLLDFPYPDVQPVEIPERNLIAVLAPRPREPHWSPSRLVGDALERPVVSPPLRGLVPARGDIVLVVDDLTRHTPLTVMLPPVIEELRAGGASPEQIKIMIALGTHRAMTPEETERHLGAEVAGSHEVINHDCHDPDGLVHLGQTQRGTDVWINKLAAEAGLLVALGHIAPHRIAGFTGGAKAIQPGISGAVTIGQTHWAAADYDIREVVGEREGAVRKEIEAVALQAGLQFIVNVVLNAKREMVGCFAGDPIEAHREGAKLAREMSIATLPEPADISLGASYPVDLDFWQACKAIGPLCAAVKRGGMAIMVTPCPEGVARHHPEVEQFGYRPVPEIRQMVADGTYTDLVAAAHCALVSQDVCERAELIVVSPHLSADTISGLGLTPAESPQAALDLAFSQHGREARIALLELAGESVVRTGDAA